MVGGRLHLFEVRLQDLVRLDLLDLLHVVERCRRLDVDVGVVGLGRGRHERGAVLLVGGARQVRVLRRWSLQVLERELPL